MSDDHKPACSSRKAAEGHFEHCRHAVESGLNDENVGRSGSLSEYPSAARELNRNAGSVAQRRRYRTPMFEFVRQAKAHPDLECMGAFDAASLVEQCLHTWGGDPSDPWLKWFPQSDDGKAEFIDTWDRIKWPRAELDRAVTEAARLPLKAVHCCSATYAQFISIAGHLQRGVEGPILLPVSRIAGILGCEPMSVTRYRRLAGKDGLLKLTTKGIRAQRKADEFIFAVALFDWQTGEQVGSEDPNLCLTSGAGCYPDIQGNHEIERKKEFQENQGKQEIQELQREARARFANEKTKPSIANGPHIPTIAELTDSLRSTEGIRRGYLT